MAKKGSAYSKLLDKFNTLDLGGGGFWKPPVGRSTFRILPPVGGMEFFFREVGQHYLGGQSFMCPEVCSDGKDPCPICEVNQALYAAGDKETAASLRVRRSFWVNILVRGQEAEGPKLYTPGVTVFSGIVTLISDPDYGDITDPDDGYDLKLDRKGEGLSTKYQLMPAARASAAGDPDDVEMWLEDATDIDERINGAVMDYDALTVASGMDAYLDVDNFGDEEDEEEEEPASARIAKRLERRRKPGGGRRRRT